VHIIWLLIGLIILGTIAWACRGSIAALFSFITACALLGLWWYLLGPIVPIILGSIMLISLGGAIYSISREEIRALKKNPPSRAVVIGVALYALAALAIMIMAYRHR
jgi:hypothetical protein